MRKFLLLTSFIVGLLSSMSAQTTRVTGVVLSEEDNEPVIGASVLVKGTSIGTTTNINGEFSLTNVPSSATTLQITYIGLQLKEVAIAPNLRILMKPDAQLLDEVVVVVAYGTAKKTSLTGAISSVNAETIEKRPVSSVTSVLEGAAPGIQVNNTFGEPGSDPTIRIRGFGTVNGSNSPLVVLNGVPFGGNISDLNPNDIESLTVLKDGTSAALYGNRAANGVILITTKKGKSDRTTIRANVKQGIYNRGLPEYEKVDPYEFMEAMWMGYRNSLVSGSNYTMEAAGLEATKELIPTYLKLNIFNKPNDQLFDANGKLVPGTQILSGYRDDLDWFKAIERTGYRQEYNISGDGAGDKGSYYLSLGYLDEKGYITHSDFSRLSGRADVTLTPKKWFKLGLMLSGSHQIKNNSNGTSSSSSAYNNPFNVPRTMAPIYPVHLHDPETGEYVLKDGQKVYDAGESLRNQSPSRNVVWERELDTDKTTRNTLGGQAFTDITFLNDFTFTLRGDLSLRQTERQKYDNATIGDGSGNKARITRTIYFYTDYTFQQQLAWRKRFNNVHTVDALLAHENYSYNSRYLDGGKSTETFAGKNYLNNFNVMTKLDGYETDYRTESYLGRVRYNYDEKYFAEASFRRDGSSRFAPGNQWGNFWSVGGNWLISEEDFMKPHANIINTLKLRASYGEVANDAGVGYYGWMALYYLDQNANKGAAYINQNEARSIKWETTASFSMALEGRLFRKLNFTLEYFDKRSKDLLFDVQLPLSAGATSTSSAQATVSKNLGTVSNRGFEFSVDYDFIRSRDFTWNLGVNGTVFKNKIISLPEQNRENGIVSGTKKYVEGGSVYDFWMYKYVGTDMMTGNALYLPGDNYYYPDTPEAERGDKIEFPSEDALVKINGQYYTTNTTYGQKDWSGSAIPSFYGGISTSFRWKDLNLSILGTYSLGGKNLDYSYQSLMTMTGSVHSLHKDVMKSWNGIPEGMTEDSPNRINKNQVPVFDYTRGNLVNATSDRFLHNASYFVLKNITLNYSLPKTFVRKFDLQDLSVSATVENLVTFTKMKGLNPQQNFNGTSDNAFVTPRVFTMGINVKF